MKLVSKILDDMIYDFIVWDGIDTDDIVSFTKAKEYHLVDDSSAVSYIHLKIHEEGIFRVQKGDYVLRHVKSGVVTAFSPNIVFNFYKTLES